jgi:hypothetical protein
MYVSCTNVVAAPPTCLDIAECDVDNGGCGPFETFRCMENFGAPPTCERLVEPGSPDPGFGDGRHAIVAVPLRDAGFWYRSLAAHSDGTFTVVGDTRASRELAPRCLVARFDATGAPITTFGVGGVFAPEADASDVCTLRAAAFDASAGETAFAGFGWGGDTPFSVYGRTSGSSVGIDGQTRAAAVAGGAVAVTVGEGGVVFAAGNYQVPPDDSTRAGLFSFDDAPAFDPDFGVEGFVSLPLLARVVRVHDTAWLDADTVLLAGTLETTNGNHAGFVVAIAISTGAIASSWGDEGWALYENGDEAARFEDIAIDRGANRVVAAGSVGFGSGEDTLVVAFTLGGALDRNFGDAGAFTSARPGRDRAYACTIGAAGSVVIAGERDDAGRTQPLVLRLDTEGLRDTAFGVNAEMATATASTDAEACDIALTRDGGIAIVGRERVENLDRGWFSVLAP